MTNGSNSPVTHLMNLPKKLTDMHGLKKANIIAQRTYDHDGSLFTVGLMAPVQNGEDWFCEVFTSGTETTSVKVGGVDALQALRLAFPVLDALVASHSGARSQGIPGAF